MNEITRRWIGRVSLATALFYVVFSVAGGITLAEMSVRMKPRPPGAALHFKDSVRTQFGTSVENVTLQARDGATLKGWYVQPPLGNGESVVLLHGVGGNRMDASGFSSMFLKRGYAVLLPDSRAHGESGGEVATYGVLERDDVARWVDWLRNRDPGCTYLLGESMGAAIGLQAAAQTSRLCAVAAESPFATFREVGYERLGWSTGTGTVFWKTVGRPLIEVAIAYTRLRYGVYLPEASPEEAVKTSRVPMLLIAGTADRNILMRNAEELQSVCSNHCELWIVQGADHGGAPATAGPEFDRRVLSWFAGHDSR